MEDNYNIDEQLRRLMQGLEVQPDIRSFDAVIRKMERKKKRRAFILFLWAGLAMLLFAPLVFSWLSAHQRRSPSFIHKSGREQASSITIGSAAALRPGAAILSRPRAGVSVSVTATAPDAGMHTLTAPEMTNKSIPPASRQKALPSAATITVKAEDDTATDWEPTITTANNSIPSPAESLSGKEPGEHYLYLPPTTASLADTLPEREAVLQLPLPYPLPLLPKPKSSEFYFGLSLNPQLGSFLVFKNPGSSPTDTAFSNFLNQARKQQYHLRLQYAFGIKAGRIYREKYELFAGFGFQRLQGWEDNTNSGRTYTTSPAIPNTQLSNQAALPQEQVYRYSYLSVEAARLYRHRSFKFRLAAGFQFNYALYSMRAIEWRSLKPVLVKYYMGGTVARWHGLAHLKFGITRQIGKMQVQLNPGVYCALNSVFYKKYILNQYPYGFQLEAVMLFHLKGKVRKPSPGP
jgi:hypothetical protein